MSSVVDMEWELVNVKKEIPQSPTFFPRSPTVKDEQQTLTTGSDAMEEEESGTPIFYGGGLCDPTLTPEKEHSRTSKPSSTGLRPRLLAIVHSCLESKVDQSLGAGENAAVGAETSPKEENVREVVLATEMHLQGSRRVLQSLIHSTEYKLLHPGDQKLARAEVRKLFGSKCVRLGFNYPQAKPEPRIEIQRSIQKEYGKGPQLFLSSTPELKTSICSESAKRTNPDSASQIIGNTGARIIESSALMNSTVIHFVIDITSTLASLQRTLSEVFTADLFFGATLKAWGITNLPNTIPNYLAVKIDNARFSKVIECCDPEGFEEILHGIMAASCWAERVGAICVVEVRSF